MMFERGWVLFILLLLLSVTLELERRQFPLTPEFQVVSLPGQLPEEVQSCLEI